MHLFAKQVQRLRRGSRSSLGRGDERGRTIDVTGILAVARELVEFSLQYRGNAALFVVLVALALREPAIVEKGAKREERRSAA